jgi:hypothetical protein
VAQIVEKQGAGGIAAVPAADRASETRAATPELTKVQRP